MKQEKELDKGSCLKKKVGVQAISCYRKEKGKELYKGQI
jgi:hypothetical protein